MKTFLAVLFLMSFSLNSFANDSIDYAKLADQAARITELQRCYGEILVTDATSKACASTIDHARNSGVSNEEMARLWQKSRKSFEQKVQLDAAADQGRVNRFKAAADYAESEMMKHIFN
jgi:hypothetical protein